MRLPTLMRQMIMITKKLKKMPLTSIKKFDKSDLVESSDKLNISLTKKDGKWDIKMKNVDGSQNEYLLESYIGHVMDY